MDVIDEKRYRYQLYSYNEPYRGVPIIEFIFEKTEYVHKESSLQKKYDKCAHDFFTGLVVDETKFWRE
ncbi:MAG: hypothetical protein K9N07_07170 [Candidatus Cloacimonetes bacterium]|nr:hypothetical protein [Candidatus Cloacimonadota bacterium]